MTYSINMSRPARTAIAAVLAATATPAFAQEVTPDPATSSSTATTPPVTEPVTAAPEATPAPAASESPTTTTTADPLAPAVAGPVVETKATKPTTTVRRTATRAAPATDARAARTAPAAPATPAASPAPAATTSVPVEEPLAATTPAAPAVEATPAPQAAAENDMLPIAGAGAVGLLALAGAGVALSRRRRRDEDEVVDTVAYDEPRLARREPVVDAPVEPVAAASAFQWGDRPVTPEPISAVKAGPGSHLEAARRGPTPENPFLSLKKRLKRASFFEQRDRLVAQGRAKPVARTAGLPAAMSKAVRQVRDSAMRPVNAARQPMNLSFNQRYQPA